MIRVLIAGPKYWGWPTRRSLVAWQIGNLFGRDPGRVKRIWVPALNGDPTLMIYREES